MTWFILTVLLGLLGGIGVVVALANKHVEGESSDRAEARTFAWVGAGAAAFVWLVVTIGFAATQISAGHVGVKYQFGKITGTVPAGFHLVAPWVNVVDANTQVQSHTFSSLASFSKETQNVDVTATLNYSVNPGDVRGLYTTVGPDWFDKLVETRVNQFFKDETVKFLAVSIAPNRDVIRTDVRQRLRDALRQYSVNVEDLLIDNITFSPAFTKAIEDKQIATQEAQAAQNRIATAQAQATQIIKTAQGQAEANRLKRETLTPLLIEQNAIDKLNPNVQVIMVPSGSSFLLPNLLPAAAGK